MEDGDAFAIPDLWKKSTLTQFDEQPTSNSIAWALESRELEGDHNGLFETSGGLDLHLPDLSSFQYGPIEDLGTLGTDSSVSSSVETLNIAATEEEEATDFWHFPRPDENDAPSAKLNSWETFYDKSFQEPRSVYISEAGSRVFDTIIAEAEKDFQQSSQVASVVVRSGPLLRSLSQLGLGRESVLYRYSEEKRSFQTLIDGGRISGYSLEAFQSVASSLIETGNRTRRLRSFIETTQSSGDACASLVALASRFSDILMRLQIQLGDASKPIHSLLQLQSQFERPASIVFWLNNILETLYDARTNEDLISRFYGMMQDAEYVSPWLRDLMLQILTCVSQPWLEIVNVWLALETDPHSGFHRQARLPNFVKVIEETRRIDIGREVEVYEYEFEPLSIPPFIDQEDAKLVFEIGRGLRLLEAHQPEHPLLGSKSSHAADFGGLEWHYSWKSIERIQLQAANYMCNLQNAIKDFELSGKPTSLGSKASETARQSLPRPVNIFEETAKAYISASISAIESPMPLLTSSQQDPLLSRVSERPESGGTDTPGEDIFAPPIALLPALSFNPLISVQAKLTNRAGLRLLFVDFDLMSHFSLLHQYSLFGNGVFASRLSHALFDPELQTAERQKGRSRGGSSGLRLGFRDTWPPASSELRLALMGILTDSWYDANPNKASSMFRGELPGGLSFSIREVSEDELQRCMNPDSVEALDFLKLEYKPPPPLDLVISQNSLSKYDAIFKLLLRILRLQFSANQLFKDTRERSMLRESIDVLTHKFRIESQHFVSAVCAYFFDGIQHTWKDLERRLQDIEMTMNGESNESLFSLRDCHEHMLDRMMFALILRKRQAQVMQLLEEIFSLVLQLSWYIRIRDAAFPGTIGSDSAANIQAKYSKFQKKVRVFISVCRGLSGRRGHSSTAQQSQADVRAKEDIDENGGNTIGQLLLKLEMSGFYALP